MTFDRLQSRDGQDAQLASGGARVTVSAELIRMHAAANDFERRPLSRRSDRHKLSRPKVAHADHAIRLDHLLGQQRRVAHIALWAVCSEAPSQTPWSSRSVERGDEHRDI